MAEPDPYSVGVGRRAGIEECIMRLCPVCAHGDDIADNDGPIWVHVPIRGGDGSWYHPVCDGRKAPGHVAMTCTAGKLWDLLEELGAD